MSKLKELMEKRATLMGELKDLELQADNLTADQEERFDAAFNDLKSINDQIEKTQKRQQMLAEMGTIQDEKRDTQTDPEKRYEDAFWKAMTRRELSVEERSLLNSRRESRAAQQSTTTTAGGFTIPQGFSNLLEVAEKFYMPFTAENGFFILTTGTGNDIPWPATNDTANKGRLLNEAANAETSADAVVFANAITLKAYKGTSDLIRMSSEILTDSYFNFQQVIAELLAERMGRLKAHSFTLGDGSTKPQGIAHKVAGTSALRVVATASTGVTRTDIVNLIYSVDAAYRNKPQFKLMMSDGILKRIVLLTVGSADDRPLWVPSMRDGSPSTIEGIPYIINNNMEAAPALNKLTVIAGDMSKFVIRKVAGATMKTSDERFMDTDEHAIVMFERFDSNLLDAGTNPIKGLYHSKT